MANEFSIQLIMQLGGLGLAAIMLLWFTRSFIPTLLTDHRNEISAKRAQYIQMLQSQAKAHEESLAQQRQDFRESLTLITTSHQTDMREQREEFTEKLGEIADRNIEEHRQTRETLKSLAAAFEAYTRDQNRKP